MSGKWYIELDGAHHARKRDEVRLRSDFVVDERDITASAGDAVSFSAGDDARAVCGVRWTIDARAGAGATVSSSRRPPSCMMNATSPAAKSSPMHTDAISVSDTSTSALMSNAVTRPMTAPNAMGCRRG